MIKSTLNVRFVSTRTNINQKLLRVNRIFKQTSKLCTFIVYNLSHFESDQPTVVYVRSIQMDVRKTFFSRFFQSSWFLLQVVLSVALLGPVLTTDMQTPPSFRSGHLDIKDAQCAKKMIGVKLHITQRSKGSFWAPTNSTFFKNGQICRAHWN